METQCRCFPYEKSIVINALYDTIEALGLCLDSSNSIRGTLVISDAQRKGSMRVALDAAGHTDRTKVCIYSHGAGKDIVNTWGDIILDELSGTIQRAHHNERVQYIEEGEVL